MLPMLDIAKLVGPLGLIGLVRPAGGLLLLWLLFGVEIKSRIDRRERRARARLRRGRDQ